MLYDINESISSFKKKFTEVQEKEWIESYSTKTSSVGIMFEHLLGKPVENLEWPDFDGIEIKTKCSTKNDFITLFSAVPDNSFFETQRLREQYGYPSKSNRQFKVFNISLFGNVPKSLSNKYRLELRVDYKLKKVVMNIFNKKSFTIRDRVSWSFELLEEKLLRKLHHLAYVKAEYKYEKGSLFFKYTNYQMYKLKGLQEFLELIDQGKIRVTFRISVFMSGKRKGETHDHGTSFDLDEHYLEKLFKKIEQ